MELTMKHELLIESLVPATCNMISESTTDGKNTWLSGIFMQADIRNRNDRIYPLHEIAAAVNEACVTIQETNGIFGELDHPQTLNINLDRVSHVITSLRMEGANAVGKMKILCGPNGTQMGNIAKSLIESGVRIGVSSRGAGAVNQIGEVSGYKFVTVDIVATPSARGATPASIYESLDGNQVGRRVLTLAEQMQQDPSAQKYFQAEIMRFLNQNLFAKR
jgi:hypothetical protein